MFANRTGWPLTPNRLSEALEKLRRNNVEILDLTESNPTKVGLHYPEDFLKPIVDPRSLSYEPLPKGLYSARQAVASVYAQKGISIDPDQILLTASTSEAYGFLFRLLCNPGDSVLIPCPSYPLFEYLAGLNDVHLAVYRLHYRQRWELDFDSLMRAISPETRAIVVVHPNNPTGSCLTSEEVSRLISVCQQKNLVLIADEVFADYFYEENPGIPRSLAGHSELMVFSLGGLSKFLALPQMKLAWIAVTGPHEQVHPALERLELIADTYLSVNTPVQQVLPTWFAKAPKIQSPIRDRLLKNRQFLLEQCGKTGKPMTCLHANGGWNSVLRLPALKNEEEFVLRLLEREHLLVHPGYFFDFEVSGYLVVSLLPPPEIFQEGISRAIRTAGQVC